MTAASAVVLRYDRLMSRTPLIVLFAVATLVSVACSAAAQHPIVRLDCGPNGEAFPLCGASRAIGRDSVGVKWQRSYVAAERAVEIAKANGARRAMLLPVSAPFHCSLMQPAADVMADALSKVTMKPPAVPLVANVLARAVSDPAEIMKSLVAQVTGTVRWRESIAFMANAGVDSFYEVGAGKVLSGLVKRIAAGASGTAIGTPDDVAAFKAARAT